MAAVREDVAAAPTTRTRNLSIHHPLGVETAPLFGRIECEGEPMNGLIYLVGLIVVIMAILSLFGLH